MSATRRSYGAGSLYVRADAAGVEMYYGRWRAEGRQMNRCLGPKRKGTETRSYHSRVAAKVSVRSCRCAITGR